MTLISSISGTRGTIGGSVGDNLTPIDIVQFAAAFGTWLTLKSNNRTIVIGRDARPSGEMVQNLVSSTLVGLGFKVLDLGISTTPTVEVAVPEVQAAGGIILTASHNPVEWNALKLLNARGEFVTKKDGLEILEILNNAYYTFSDVRELGSIEPVSDWGAKHIDKILALPLVDKYAVEKAKLKIVVDGVNSSGGIYVPQILEAMGIAEIVKINCEPSGWFSHNPEPLEKNLTEICDYIKANGADLGICVDPDVDRLVFIDNEGKMFGEEYTLVAVADYVLQHTKSAVVSNLSSSRALRDLAERHGCPYYASAVGEVNVVEIMKRRDALIGGEGNGGIIYPELHYGRDALVGIALFLSHLVKSGKTAAELRATYPNYFMAKEKIQLTPGMDIDGLLAAFKEKYKDEKVNDIDGVKVDFEESWVHLRKSNTEPIIRIYTEAKSQEAAQKLAQEVMEELASFA
ncbi:phosphoglucosamine mutase [Pontibacter sp. G13]|uniref:phosphoglucosamine mutase n=1 Tax=Pontibacter sp. G13 TaxID=3074898 RepID=UPI00288AE574|nr:phosphoglucosamine mutase [Pontibacter sp. G13]WNJ16759.1 phosphoglucosamine mutase [Pontibacter sp. G13]